VLRAYLDESGHESKGWVFLAGFVGTEEQWRDFVPKWRTGLGKRNFLHMNELRWKSERTRKLLERLGPIPASCGLEGCMGGVRVKDYEDLLVGTEDEKLLRGYIACLFPLLIQILRGTPRSQRIELVFEEQRQYAPFVEMALSMFAATSCIPGAAEWKSTPDGKPRLAKWSFVPKGSTIMTDPADYLAFALREAWTNKNSKKTQWCQPMLTSGGGHGYGSIMNRERIRRSITNAQNMMFWQTIYQQVTEMFLGVRDEARIRVPKVRQHNAEAHSGSSQSDQGQAGSGKSREKA